MVIMLNGISRQRPRGIGKRHTGGLTTLNETIFNMNPLNLLAKYHPFDMHLLKMDPATIKNSHTQPTMLRDRQSLNRDIGGSIRPFANMKRSYPLLSGEKHTVNPFPHDEQSIFAVDRHIFSIRPGFNHNSIARSRLINGFLNQGELT